VLLTVMPWGILFDSIIDHIFFLTLFMQSLEGVDACSIVVLLDDLYLVRLAVGTEVS